MLDNALRKYFVRLHGEGAPHQADLYRCTTCKNLITWKKIRTGDVCCGARMVPANPKFFEKVRLFLAPWSF